MKNWNKPVISPQVQLITIMRNNSRRIEDRTELRVKLFSTATHEQLWENSFDVSSSGDRAMPGISTEQRKFQVAVWSLRDLVNQIVEDLAEASFAVPG